MSAAGTNGAGPGATVVEPFDALTDDLSTTPCRDHDPDLWFADRPADIAVAQALCGGCPLRLPCLAGAIRRGEPWGVWGGELFENGAVIARKRPPGRPRKDDAVRAARADDLLRQRLAALSSAGASAQ